jgi:hypothetical protein
MPAGRIRPKTANSFTDVSVARLSSPWPKLTFAVLLPFSGALTNAPKSLREPGCG